MDENLDKNPELAEQKELVCKNCGGKIQFSPGSTSVKCPYCGTVNEITFEKEELEKAFKEIDYYSYINKTLQTENIEVKEAFVKCQSCGASTTIDSNVVSSECPYCGSPLVREQAKLQNIIEPQAVIPFVIDKKQAIEKFNTWMKKSFWAPKKAKVYAKPDKLQGLYTPYWTYDANTTTSYVGQRGDDYTTTETYTDSSGQTQTRSVTKTRWTRTSGTVYQTFDDIPIVASTSLPEKYVTKLQPWDTSQLKPYNKLFLAGFKSESYTRDVKKGFELAKVVMDKKIVVAIERDIGGDHQRITSKNTNYNDVTFKHILLPIWISSYKYKDKVYNFVVNGQTGKVQGKRPVSVGKIILVILLAIAIIVALYFIFGQ